MCPTLFQFQLGGQWLAIPAYGTAMMLAVVAIAFGGWAVAARRQMPRWPALVCSASLALALPVGSRMLYWVMNSDLSHFEPGLLVRAEFSGFYIIGGLTLAVATGVVLCWLLQLNFWRMADSIAPAMGLGGAILRAGCFLNGCCFGRPTSLPWGVTFPVGSPAHLDQASERLEVLFTTPLPVHPTQIYELAALLAVAAMALVLLRRRFPDGTAALAVGALFILFRWLNSSLRAYNPAQNWPASVATVLYASAIMLCTAMLVWRMCRTAVTPGVSDELSPTAARALGNAGRLVV